MPQPRDLLEFPSIRRVRHIPRPLARTIRPRRHAEA